MSLFHYTDKIGWNAIRSQVAWVFKAGQPPPQENPFGAYFTDYDEGEPKLANKLRLPREKVAYLFAFCDNGDLLPYPGDRGKRIFYSPTDYSVAPERQIRCGATGL